jgi:hypothetical protein
MTDRAKMFISYRRGDPGNYGRHVYRWARDYFGRDHAFIDVETIGPGDSWADKIRTAVGESRVMLVVIGREWAALAKSDDDQDFVELEVKLALEREDVAVIPVLVDGAQMPPAAQLPASIEALGDRQAHRLHDDFWDEGIERLRVKLEECGMQKLEAPPEPPEEVPVVHDDGPHGTEPDPPSPAGLALQGVLLALGAGLLANWMVSELMPSPDEQGSEAAGIAVSVARRAAAWAIVGAALAIWLAIAQRAGRRIPVSALVGLLVGGLAGAIGGTIDALPGITNEELGSWVDAAALGTTGALVGALLGGRWEPRQLAYGLAAGGAAGVLVQVVFGSPENPGEAAIRVALIAGVILSVLAALALAAGPVARNRPAPHTH